MIHLVIYFSEITKPIITKIVPAIIQIFIPSFKKKYEIDPENPSLCRPKGGPQIFVQITDNIIVNQWGSDMQIAAGGYINITNVDDMYGISERDFG